MKAWFAPVLGSGGAVVPTHQKELKEGRHERIEHLSAYVQNGYLTADVLDKLHQQIYEDACAKAKVDGYQTGYDKGFEQGKQAGQQSGYEQGKNQVQREVQQLKQVIERLMDPLNHQEAQLEQWILQTVKQICLGVLRQYIDTHEALLLSFVQEAIRALPAGCKQIEIHLSEEDLQLVKNFTSGKQLPWELFSDRDLSRGDCRVVAGESRVDFTLSQRIEQALNSLQVTETALPAVAPNTSHASLAH